MDIQVASNFERLFYELKNCDANAVAGAMARFRSTGTMPVTAAEWRQAKRLFTACSFDDDATLAEIARTWRASRIMLDPHSAIGVAAARAHRAKEGKAPIVSLATAHPAKFPDAIERAIGVRPKLPPRLADLPERPERLLSLPNSAAAVEDYIRSHARPLREVAA